MRTTTSKLHSKQQEIRKKLAQSGITKPEEFESIISNLIGQRERLQSDLHTLRHKVVALQNKKQRKATQPTSTIAKQPRPHTTNSTNQRDQLVRKYEELKQWQKRSRKMTKNSTVQTEYRGYLDNLFNLEQQIQAEVVKFNDEKNAYRRLKKAVKQMERQQQKSTTVQTGISRQNHLLKRRVVEMKRIVDRQMSKEIDLQQCLYQIKDKERDGQERGRMFRQLNSRLGQSLQARRQESQGTPVAKEVSISSQGSEESVEREQEVSLKFLPSEKLTSEDIYQLEGHLTRTQDRYRQQINKIERRVKQHYPNQALNMRREGSKLTFSKELELTLDRSKNTLNQFGELSRQKVKLLLKKMAEDNPNFAQNNELNYNSASVISGSANNQYQDNYYAKSRSARKLKNIVKEQLKPKETVSKARTFEESGCSTEWSEYNDLYPLRRELAGELLEVRTDDRNILQAQRNSTIRTLHIYYTDRGIAGVQAVYNLNSGEETVEGGLNLPKSFIANYCKIHTVDTSDQDFIRYLKVRYHQTERRITSIKVVTNKNLKGGFGDHKIKPQEKEGNPDPQLDRDWVFDINRDEFPVCLFSGLIQRGPYWYLCGLGVEINEL